MVVPQTFRTGQRTLVNVGLTDLATGRNRVDLYAGFASGQNILSNVPFYSDGLVVYMGAFADPVVGKHEFDMDFELPQIIGGKCITQIPVIHTLGGTPVGWTIIGVSMAKISTANVATTLISGLCHYNHNDTSYKGTAYVSGGRVLTRSFDFPNTKFKKGEKLRLVLWTHSTDLGPTGLCADPFGRSIITGKWKGAEIGSTKCIVQMPFKINI